MEELMNRREGLTPKQRKIPSAEIFSAAEEQHILARSLLHLTFFPRKNCRCWIGQLFVPAIQPAMIGAPLHCCPKHKRWEIHYSTGKQGISMVNLISTIYTTSQSFSG